MVEIKVLEERMDNLIVTNKKEHAEIKASLSVITNKLDNLSDDFPTRAELSFAKERIKNIENILKGAGGTVLVAILGSLLKLVLK